MSNNQASVLFPQASQGDVQATVHPAPVLVYGENDEIPEEYRKFIQWQPVEEFRESLKYQFDVHRFNQYVDLDVKTIWGWTVGTATDYPALRMSPAHPDPPIAKNLIFNSKK